MHEELEVGARARLPDAEEKSSAGKQKKKLKFEPANKKSRLN